MKLEILGLEWHTRVADFEEGHGVARIDHQLVAFRVTSSPGRPCNPFALEARNVSFGGRVYPTRRRRGMRYATRERFAAAVDAWVTEHPIPLGLPTRMQQLDARFAATDGRPDGHS